MSNVHYPDRKPDEKRAQERLRLTVVRLKAFVWSAKSDEPVAGFSFVSDLSDTGAGLYVAEGFQAGQSIRVAFEDMKSNTYKGVVMWSNRFNLDQHFIGQHAMTMRLGIKLQFSSEAERQFYLKYRAQLKDRVLSLGLNSNN